jgi:hypothetical protein
MKNLLILLFFPFVLLGQNNSFIDLLKKHFENKHPELMDRDDQLDHCSNIADRTLEPKSPWDGLNSEQIRRQVSVFLVS